ncbi:hypothetical protein [Streptomyces sp. NPDC048106]|uniref:hypothetical protein n=1 Tax=Streptomyces sp. NPDC048106 TaxID=3155750 RepID=UPI003455FAC5
MDFDALRDGSFSQLQDAIADWEQMTKNLATLASDARDNLKAKANKANWTGVNAQVSREFIDKTAEEFTDAHTQADSITSILKDTHGELLGYHGQLHDALTRAQQHNIVVTDTGHGTFRVMSGPATGDTTQKDVDAVRDEIQRILTKATTSDTTAARALRMLVDETKYGFSDASYRNRDQAAKALQEADELAKLAKKNPRDLTAQDIEAINEGLKKYHNDPLFSQEFTEHLGAKGTENFWLGLTDGREGAPVGYEITTKLADLQKNLSLTLATASHSDSPDMTAWKQQVIGNGGEAVGTRGNVLGFQVMSNLMRDGDFDDTFMTNYGQALMKTERFYTDDGKNMAWQHNPTGLRLNYEGGKNGDDGWDPVNGYLKGLSHNPDAATDFFNDDFISQDSHHKSAVSNFKYLFTERHWPNDSINLNNTAGQKYLSQAIEAATTGHPAGERPTLALTGHSAGEAHLYSDLVNTIADKPELLTDRSYMAGNFGQITSEYLPDINRGVSDSPNKDHLYPINGSSAQLGLTNTSKFLFALGQDPHGYAPVELSQKAYLSNLLQYQLDPDLPANQHAGLSPMSIVRDTTTDTGQISGMLHEGRMEAIGSAATGKDDSYGHAAAQYQNLISGVVGTGIGAGTSCIGSPLAGAVVGGAAGTATNAALQWLFQDAEGNATDDAHSDEGDAWDHGLDINKSYAGEATKLAVQRYHLKSGADLEDTAEIEAGRGYRSAQQTLHGVAPGINKDVTG